MYWSYKISTISDVIINFGDVFKLDVPVWNVGNITKILESNNNWVSYNPRKSNKRLGLSVTSLDGLYSGIPDLDSLREYNQLHNKAYNENHFKTRTSIVQLIPELEYILELFPDHGRCHFIRLDAGGFFPPHRDNGLSNIVPQTFRIIVPVNNFNKYCLTWVQDGSLLEFDIGSVYFINTTKVHSLFSYVDNSICFVMNVICTPNSLKTLVKHSYIK